MKAEENIFNRILIVTLWVFENLLIMKMKLIFLFCWICKK